MTYKCDYCGNDAKLVTGDIIYPHRQDLHAKHFWNCTPCKAFVGCHPNTDKPLGRLANAELRRAKMAAHAAFDPRWREGQIKRASAYKWLAESLGIARKDCHIGMFDVDMCKRVVDVCHTIK